MQNNFCSTAVFQKSPHTQTHTKHPASCSSNLEKSRKRKFCEIPYSPILLYTARKPRPFPPPISHAHGAASLKWRRFGVHSYQIKTYQRVRDLVDIRQAYISHQLTNINLFIFSPWRAGTNHFDLKKLKWAYNEASHITLQKWLMVGIIKKGLKMRFFSLLY